MEESNVTRPDSRHPQRISDEDFERISLRTAQLVEERFFAAVGRTVSHRILQFIGTCVFAILAWEITASIGLKHEKIWTLFGLLER